jgi:GDP-D-mannose dehydratase
MAKFRFQEFDIWKKAIDIGNTLLNSRLRPKRFVTQKIVSAACRITAGSSEKLQLGNTDIRRDWGMGP